MGRAQEWPQVIGDLLRVGMSLAPEEATEETEVREKRGNGDKFQNS